MRKGTNIRYLDAYRKEGVTPVWRRPKPRVSSPRKEILEESGIDLEKAAEVRDRLQRVKEGLEKINGLMAEARKQAQERIRKENNERVKQQMKSNRHKGA